MIVDLRIYKCKPGRMNDWVALYKEMGWPLQQKYLGKCLGWYTTAEGELNCVVHLWGYKDQGDREERRNKMAADPAWQAFQKAGKELDALVSQENRFLKPTDFSPVQ